MTEHRSRCEGESRLAEGAVQRLAEPDRRKIPWPQIASLLRILQVLHLAGIVAAAVIYTILKALLPPEDPYHQLVDVTSSVALVVWSALVFIELLRGRPEGSLQERLLNAYRRLLNRLAFLITSDAVLIAGCVGGLWLLLMFRSVEIVYHSVEPTSPSDVSIYQQDSTTRLHRVGRLDKGGSNKFRLRVGKQWLVFYTDQKKPVYSRRIDVPPPWREMEAIKLNDDDLRHYL